MRRPLGEAASAAVHERVSGFTLLELLVVLVIGSLILASLASGLRFVTKLWQGQQNETARDADIGAVETMLDRLVGMGWNFRGDAHTLEFYGAMPRALALPGVYAIKLSQADDRLMLAWKSALAASPPPRSSGEAPLIDDVANLRIAYLPHDDGKTQASWSEATPSDQSTGTALIRIAVVFDPSTARRWPELVIAPKIDPGAQESQPQ